MKRQEWLLVLLHGGAAADGPLDRVRVQKGLFVIGDALDPSPYYAFQPYHYGPFDATVYADAELLVAGGLLRETKHRGYAAYELTPAGEKSAGTIEDQIDRPKLEFVRGVREWIQRVDFNTMLRAIYAKWPSMRAQSRFVDQDS